MTYRICRDPKSLRRLEVDLDAFNSLNHVNFENYVGIMTSPYFGLGETARSGHQLQFSMNSVSELHGEGFSRESRGSGGIEVIPKFKRGFQGG